MSRPEVSLQNQDACYEFYEHHEQNQMFARFGHFVLSKMYRPIVTYDQDGAAEEAIREEFEENRRIALAPNHLTDADQYVLISLVRREKVLRPFIGNSFMPAKASLFTRSPSKGGLVLRWALDELGAIPVIRQEDIRRQGIEMTPEIEELHRKAMLQADEVQVARLISGKHIGDFSEGTRNRKDHTQVQPLKKGFAHTALKAAKNVGVSIVPMGMYYGEPDDYDMLVVPNKHTPHIHIGMPFRVDPDSSPEDLTSQLYPAIQSCVDVAVSELSH